MPGFARVLVAVVFSLVTVHSVAAQIVKKCPPDSVKVGNTCIDTYEASVWQVPDPTGAGKSLVKKIAQGKATLANLTDAGAVQLGCTFAPFSHTAYPANFPTDGNWTPLLGSVPPTPGVYAVSVAGVLPTTCITQFQAAQACAIAGRRLIRNDEWQRAASGTPDPGAADDNATQCETGTDGFASDAVNTGSRTGCKSNWGTFDMVGNVWEWVSDWTDHAIAGTDWTTEIGLVGGDYSAFGGDGSGGQEAIPGAPVRGGDYATGTYAGVFAVDATRNPRTSGANIGFRCAR